MESHMHGRYVSDVYGIENNYQKHLTTMEDLIHIQKTFERVSSWLKKLTIEI
jgi:hypothetical protein